MTNTISVKQIKILLSSVLTLLLITGNNASYASLNFEEIKVTYKPNIGNAGRFMPKRNRLGDDACTQWIASPGCNNILKKGNVFRGNVRVLPNRGSYTDSGRVTYIRSGKDGFLNEATLYQNGKDGFIVQAGEDGLHNNGAFRERINDVSISGSGQSEDVVTTLEHGPGLHDSYDTDHGGGGAHGVQQPKGVPLKFIKGKWVEIETDTEDGFIGMDVGPVLLDMGGFELDERMNNLGDND